MQIQHLLVAFFVSFVSSFADTTAGAGALEGQWLLEESGRHVYDVRLTYRETSATGNWHEQTTRTMAPETLTGLDEVALRSEAGSTISFSIHRDAGTLRCEGWAKNGHASGHYIFIPDLGFAGELDRLGFGKPSDRELLSLALSSTGMDLVREIGQSKYEGVTVSQLVRAAHHGVTSDYIRGLRELGFTPSSLGGVVRMRDHGVTLEYIREIRLLGIKDLDEREMTRLRDHGVTPDFVRGMKDAGYDGLDAGELTRLRDHGITPEFAREMQAAGFGNLAMRDLVRLRDHGVTPQYVLEIRAAGLAKITVAEVVRLRDHGVRAEDVRALRE